MRLTEGWVGQGGKLDFAESVALLASRPISLTYRRIETAGSSACRQNILDSASSSGSPPAQDTDCWLASTERRNGQDSWLQVRCLP